MAKQSLEVGGDPRLACSAVFSVTSVLFLSLWFIHSSLTVCATVVAREERALPFLIDPIHNSTRLDSTRLDSRNTAYIRNFLYIYSRFFFFFFFFSSLLWYYSAVVARLCNTHSAQTAHTSEWSRAHSFVLFCTGNIPYPTADKHEKEICAFFFFFFLILVLVVVVVVSYWVPYFRNNFIIPFLSFSFLSFTYFIIACVFVVVVVAVVVV